MHHDSLMYEDGIAWLSKRYGDRIGGFLARRLSKMIRETGNNPCMDNFRACDLANDLEVKAYEKAVGHGCCGYADEKFDHWPSGRSFRIGFNYGH